MKALDFLLLLMILIWGSNFSVVKVALRDFPEVPFNTMRMLVGTTVFLAAIRWTRDPERPRPRRLQTRVEGRLCPGRDTPVG